ncbi:MAG: NAAT family transporter [Bacteroidetes bacterium]|nr:NAAT family transporter [Bacteroidota bacterium]
MNIMDQFTTILLYLTSFFTLMNPIGTMPVFLSMTSELSKRERRATAMKAVLTAAFALILFAFLGKYLFDFFGISVAGLKVVGGILFFIIGYDMLNARISRLKLTKKEATQYADDISITPLGIPMIAGPGAITNAIVLMGDSQNLTSKFLVILSIVIVLLIVWMVLVGAVGITKFMGERGNKIMMKLMGLIVMVIAVEFFFSGLTPYIQAIIK